MSHDGAARSGHADVPARMGPLKEFSDEPPLTSGPSLCASTLASAPQHEIAWVAAHGVLRHLDAGVLTSKDGQVEGLHMVLAVTCPSMSTGGPGAEGHGVARGRRYRSDAVFAPARSARETSLRKSRPQSSPCIAPTCRR